MKENERIRERKYERLPGDEADQSASLCPDRKRMRAGERESKTIKVNGEKNRLGDWAISWAECGETHTRFGLIVAKRSTKSK